MKRLARSLYFSSTLLSLWLFVPNRTPAQIIPDTTLPNNSITIPNGNNIRIEGGTINGSNLFHSFQEFSLPTGSEAFFNNGLNIQNIFSRVTGKNISNIDGLMRANGIANLFLINPNGIIFGPNAQLNIGGSFLASTANSIRFADGIEFSASHPATTSLLTINLPVGFQFQSNNGSIVNRSQATAPVNLPPLPIQIPISNHVGLAVAPGQTLALVAGDIQLDRGNLTANTGQIILGSVAGSGLVSFAPTPLGLNLNYDRIQNFGNIQISNESTINTSGIGGGKVDIRGGNITISGSRIYALTLGNIDGIGIDITAKNLQLQQGTQLSTLVLGEGSGGNININATDSVAAIGIGLENYQRYVVNFISSGTINPFDSQNVMITATSGTGTAGNISINSDRISIDNGTVAGSATLGAGNAGNMTIRARVFDLIGSAINNGTIEGSTGKGGNFNFEGEHFTVRDGSFIGSITRSNAASGNINIQASESVEVLRTPAGSSVQTVISTSAVGLNGQAGDITIDTKRLTISDGAGITSSSGATIGNQIFNVTAGAGGNLNIRASESIELAGISGVLANGSQSVSFLGSDTSSPSPGGDITISTPALTLRNGGVISAASLGAGNAGNITIDAARLELIGDENLGLLNTQIQASVGNLFTLKNPNATGNAGSLTLNVDRLIVRDGATVNVQALGTGNAGNLNVTANTIALENGGTLNGATESGAGANITLLSRQIQLRGNSNIGTNAGSSDGGNITIDTDTLVALENSDITANAKRGTGGRVSITTQGIFGTQFRDESTELSDITATSDLGAEFNGTVEINTPDVDPSSGLVELSTNLVDVSDRVASACPASSGNAFVVTGRGGLPADPNQTLLGRTIWRDVRSFGIGRGGVGARGRQATPNSAAINQNPITEATAWEIDRDGVLKLVANSDRDLPASAWHRETKCDL